MDAEITSRYGQVKLVRDEDIIVDVEELENIINEFDQIRDEETTDIIDRDEQNEYEAIEPEAEKD